MSERVGLQGPQHRLTGQNRGKPPRPAQRQLRPHRSRGLRIVAEKNFVPTHVIVFVDFVDLVHRGVLRMPLIRVCLPNMNARETCEAILPLLPNIVVSIGEGQSIIEIR